MDAIRSISTIQPVVQGSVAATKPTGQGPGFGEFLKTALQEVNQLQLDADTAARELLLGRIDMHQAMIATEKASLAMDLTIQVRNKLIEAYQEIMRMQI